MAKRLELLAPAGDFPSMIAAVEAGADSVCFGLKEFNMRYSAKNFTIDNLKKINDICKGVKKYLTLNTIIYDNELKDLEKLIKRVKGKVENYWPKVRVAAIKITSRDIKVGDDIYIIGSKTGVIRTKIERIEIKHKPVNEARREMIVRIKTPTCKRGDEVFLIKKN